MKFLSHSEMAMWRRCRRKWWLSQHRGLRNANEVDFNRPLGVGNRVHDTLAYYYDPDRRNDVAGVYVPVMEYFEVGVNNDLGRYPEHQDEILKEADVCRTMLDGYWQWLAETGADQGLSVVESEKAVAAPLIDGVTLISKLDARVDHEELGGRYAIEHKTVSGSIKPPAHLKFATQFLTEHLAEFLSLRQESREEQGAVGVLWNALLKSKRTARAKGPFYHREPVRHGVDQLRSHWYHVVAIAQEILDAERRLGVGESHHTVCHPNPTPDCSWDCQFKGVCLTLDENETRAESALASQFRVADPLERYQGLLPDLIQIKQ